MSSDGEARLERAISPVCTALGVDVIDVEFRPGNISVTIDRPSGLDLDHLAEASKAISALLDEDASLSPDGHYELEVSSPGLERRLRRPAHFQSVIGANVAVRTLAGTPGERRVTGKVISADEVGVEIELLDSSTVRHLSYSDIERARTVVDWTAALREGKARLRDEKVAMS